MIQDRRQPPFGHTGPAQYPLTLHQSGRRNDENVIAPALAAAFEEQRYIEHDDRLSSRASKSEEALLPGRHHRMNNSLEPGQSFRVREHAPAEQRAIDPAFGAPNTRKRRRDQGYRRATRRQQPVNHAVGIEERNSKPPQSRRGGALAHADRTREAENDHLAGAKLASIVARSSRVTRTATPNQASNPGRP